MSLQQEIRRDPAAADFVFSVFATALGTPFLIPEPARELAEVAVEISKELPSMKEIAALGASDDVVRRGGKLEKNRVDLLRWVMFTNRAHLISVPPKLKVRVECQAQFLSLMSTPEREDIFMQLKKMYGSIFVWHGSAAAKWYSIQRRGLMNMSNTKWMSAGAAYGPGIYFASDAGTSSGYAQPATNGYAESQLGKRLTIIALCEVARVPSEESEVVVHMGGSPVVLRGFFKHHGRGDDGIHTLTMEEACVVRMLFVGGKDGVGDLGRASALRDQVPSLRDVQRALAESKSG
jgi:hypothetical protein